MQKFRALLAKIPLMPLILISLMLGLAPFVPEPHLWEKLKMLANGTLTKPIDIFDLLMHGLPVTILILKLLFEKKEPAET
ncbi:MAG: RND transporter [Thiolinea sp.]